MRIVIETVPHKDQRYPTVGDWWRDADGTMQIRASDLPDARMALLIAFHELIEAHLCEQRGISEESVKSFDLQHQADDDPWVNDPGHCPEAPYHKEHVFAECLERLFALELGVNWHSYESACLALG